MRDRARERERDRLTDRQTDSGRHSEETKNAGGRVGVRKRRDWWGRVGDCHRERERERGRRQGIVGAASKGR